MYKFFIVLMLAAGCGAGLEPESESQTQPLRSSDPMVICPANQVLICHVLGGNGEAEALCVGASAVAGHLQQGDFVGPCASVGVPPSVPEPPIPDWTPRQPTPPAQLAAAAPTLLNERPGQVTPEPEPSWTPQPQPVPEQLAAESGGDRPSWTPQVPTPPAPVCASLGDACGGTFGGCCDGLQCSWGLCVPQ